MRPTPPVPTAGFFRTAGRFICLTVALTVLLLSMAVGHASVAAAANVVVKAAEVTAPADIIYPNGKRRPLEVGRILQPSHSLECGVKGRAMLSLSDGSTVTVYESSRIEINELLPEEKSRFSVSLFFGRITAAVNKLRGDDMVVTKTVVAGVRGTEFTVAVADDGTSVVTVDKGEVEVFTDKSGDETAKVKVEPGQEVQAEEAGAVLSRRPAQITSEEKWNEFRAQRLELMKKNLPLLVGRLETRIDEGLKRLEQIKAQPQDRTKVLEKLQADLKGLPRDDAVGRAKLTISAHMEASNALDLARRFRLERMRLKSTLAETERLKSLLPSMTSELGGDFKEVEATLDRIMQRREEIQQKTDLYSQEFRQAMTPVGSLLKDFGDQPFGLPGGK